MTNEEETPNCKVVLLGETGVGKTCIISRYIRNAFNPETEISTMASFTSKTLTMNNNTKLRFDIWDTAGQEKYRSLTRFFYKDAAIAVLVYDITRKESFEEIKTYWVAQLQECVNDNLVIGIAGNKSDLFTKEAVKEEEAKEFARSINAVFMLTSANTGAGVDQLFQCLGEAYLSPDKASRSFSVKDPKKITLNNNSNSDNKKGGCCGKSQKN